MTRRRNLPLLLFAAFTLFLGSCVPLTPASSAYPNPSSLPKPIATSSPTPVQATPTIGAVMDLSMPTGPAILWATVSPAQASQNEAVLAIARPLIEKAQKVYSTPGWIHFQSKTESFRSDSSTLPDGSPVPTKWQDDSWTLVDEHGRAVQSVSFQDTGDKKTSQIGIFQNGVWKNITFGTTSDSKEKTYPLYSDSGFLDRVENDKNKAELKYDTDTIGAERVAVFTITYAQLISFEGKKQSQATATGFTKFYFSLDTGVLLKIEDYRPSPEGQIQLNSRITILVVEKVEQPPAKFMKYFE